MKAIINKAIILCVLICVLATSSVMPVYAGTAVKKLGRGICNVATSPLEIFKGMSDVNKEEGIFAAFSWGLAKGLFKTGIRAAVGLYEVLTFPIPVPKDYDPILTDPEFFGEDTIF